MSSISNLKIMAVDYGEKVIGLALYNAQDVDFIQNYGHIKVQSPQQAMSQLIDIIKNEQIELLVFGVPLYKDGSLSPIALIIQKWANQVAFRTNVQIHFQDETLTSFEAKTRLQSHIKKSKIRKEQIDEESAKIILQDFISEHKK